MQQDLSKAAAEAVPHLRDILRLKWLPFAEGFDPKQVDEYQHFLDLTDDEQTVYLATLDAEQAELFIALLTSRAMYKDPVDREPGSITQEKVDRYPERYKWNP